MTSPFSHPIGTGWKLYPRLNDGWGPPIDIPNQSGLTTSPAISNYLNHHRGESFAAGKSRPDMEYADVFTVATNSQEANLIAAMQKIQARFPYPDASHETTNHVKVFIPESYSSVLFRAKWLKENSFLAEQAELYAHLLHANGLDPTVREHLVNTLNIMGFTKIKN